MKRTLKIATLFIVIISLFTLSASAQGKTIEWNDGYDTVTYHYGGELKLGMNTISPVSKPNIFDNNTIYFDNVYYEFEVEKSGYYCVEAVGDLFFTPSISQNISDGVVYGEEEYVFLNEGIMIYLEEGDSFFGVSILIYEPMYPNDIYSGEINIEYIAEEIIDMQVEDEYLEDIVFEEHICSEYDDDDSMGGIPVKGKLIFNGGKEKEFDQYLNFEYPEDIAPGKTEITFILPKYKKSFAVDIKTVADFIEKIEIGNADEVAVVTQTFVPYIAFTPEPDNIELIITMPDGTKKTECVSYYYDFELKGEKYLSIWCEYYQKEDNEWYLVVEVSDKEYLSVPCEKVPASFTENYFLYIDGIIEFTFIMFDDISWYISDAFDLFSGMSVNERIQCLSDAFTSIGNYYSDIYNLTEMFINYVR